MFLHSPLIWSTAAFVLLTLSSAEFNGQVHRNDDGLLSLPRSSQLPSALNSSGVAFPPGNGENVLPPKDDDVDIYPELWVSDLFYRTLVNFTIQRVGSSACQRQVDMYVRNLQNYTDWAVRMAESWNRHPIGILAGNKYHMGIYDECVDVNYPVKGQYCLSEIHLFPPMGKNYSFQKGTDNINDVSDNHAWKTVLGWVDSPDLVKRNSLNLGICIPDSCSAADLQTSLQNEFDKVFLPEKFKAVVQVDPILCTVSGDMYPYDMAYFLTSAFFVLLVMICCGVTVGHFIKLSRQQNKTLSDDEFFISFSFIKSVKELLKYDKTNELNILNGLKVTTMIFILFGHRFMYLVGNPMSHSKIIENMYMSGPDIILTSMNLVDPFFYLSGFILYMTTSPIFMKAGSVWIKLASPVIYRIVRMLPAYCAMMAITANIVPHLGDGPFWPQKTWSEAETCKKYWWTNLLFISNFIDAKYECLIVSWYISCDVQFFIVGVVLVYIYTKNTKYGIGLLSTIIIASMITPFISTILNKNDGILKIHIPFLENPRTSTTFNESYRATHLRATPFFVGVAMSFVADKLKKTKTKLSLITVYGGTLVVIVVSLCVQLYGAKFYARHRPYNLLEQALYSTFSHWTWTAIGLLTKIFDNRLIVPMGKLSYCVFLVNLIVMMMSQSSQRLPTYPSAKSLLDAWIYDTFKTYLMGLALYLVVEAPFGDLTRKMFGRGKKSDSSIRNEVPIEKTTTAETPKKVVTHL
ncbi:nose resistant to fluoxetine protein 6-like isoform X2 [Metopolophium dirhodum]|uniref:nose resistant to fluoxetine protein 6-like isoform X2 n=1 Tax=Metopolophium dirhodum TaxID=44670 RepID=UPI00298FEB2B|nr:nose resistant to fluoxetine protein 6-like isoform X2 [Metopolophium dirhodum]